MTIIDLFILLLMGIWINSSATNILVHVFWWTKVHISVDRYLGMELLNHCARIHLAFLDTAKSLSKVVVPIYIATCWAWVCQWDHRFLLAPVRYLHDFTLCFQESQTRGFRQRVTFIQSLEFLVQGWKTENWRCWQESGGHCVPGLLMTLGSWTYWEKT